MKIFYLGYDSSPDRAPHQEMATLYLAKRGHSVDYACWGGAGSGPAVPHENITYLPQPKAGIFSAVRLLLWLISKLAFSKAYDAVYIQGAQQTPFLFWFPLFKRDTRLIYHSQDYLEPRRHRFYEYFERRLARRADYVVSNEINRGRFMRSHYGLPHEPVIVRTALPAWWNVPGRDEARRESIIAQAGIKAHDRAVIIISGGPYRDDRMSAQLMEAFASLPENYILVFNGFGMDEGGCNRTPCEKKMAECGVSGRVVFFGCLEFDELLQLYSGGDVGVLLYPNDGVGHFYQCPGRLSEYLRGGLSLVASRFPGLELLILKYKLGAACDAEVPEEIAEALQAAGEHAAEERARILQLANDEFVYEKTAGVLEELLNGTYIRREPSVVT